MAQINFAITTQNEKALFDELRKAQREIRKLNREMGKIGKEGKNSFSGIAGELKSVVASLMGPLSISAAIGLLVNQFRELYQIMQQNRREADKTHLDAGAARAAALNWLPRDFKGGWQEFDRMVERVAKKSQLPIAQVYTVSEKGLSAKGAANNPQLEEALTLASMLQVRTKGKTQGGPMVGSILDLLSVTGIKSAKANYGWLRQIGSSARIESVEGLMDLIPGMVTAMSFGDTPEQSAELLATATKTMVDTGGEASRTAIQNLSKDLYTEKLMPIGKKADKSGKLNMQYGRLPGKNSQERMAALMEAFAKADKETQIEMIKMIGGRAKSSSLIMGMLNNSVQFRKNLESSRRQIGAPSLESASEADIYFKQTYQGKYGKVLKADIETEANIDKIKAANTAGALENQSYKKYKETLTAWGQSPRWEGTVSFFRFFKGTGFTEELINQLKGQRRYLKQDVLKSSVTDEKIDKLIHELELLGQEIKNARNIQEKITNLREKQQNKESAPPAPASQETY